MKKNKKYKDIYGSLTGRTLNLGLMVGVSIAICTFLGYKADEIYNCAPKGIIGGALFGIVAGLVNMFEHLNTINKNLNDANEKRKEKLPKS